MRHIAGDSLSRPYVAMRRIAFTANLDAYQANEQTIRPVRLVTKFR